MNGYKYYARVTITTDKRWAAYLYVPSLTDHAGNMRWLAKHQPKSWADRRRFARRVAAYAKATRQKYPLPYTIDEAAEKADAATLRRWLKSAGPPAFIRRHYIRVRGLYVETSSGLEYPVFLCRQLLAVIDDGQCEGIFDEYAWKVSGDELQVGCHRFSLRQVRSELSRPRRGA